MFKFLDTSNQWFLLPLSRDITTEFGPSVQRKLILAQVRKFSIKFIFIIIIWPWVTGGCGRSTHTKRRNNQNSTFYNNINLWKLIRKYHLNYLNIMRIPQ